jgi:hypothetical protein
MRGYGGIRDGDASAAASRRTTEEGTTKLPDDTLDGVGVVAEGATVAAPNVALSSVVVALGELVGHMVGYDVSDAAVELF